MKKCVMCGEESEILLPLKVVTSEEIEDLKLCRGCFEVFLEANSERNSSKIHSLTYKQYEEGKCRACGYETKFLRKIYLTLGEKEREIRLCPYCVNALRLMYEKGELRKFYPVSIQGFD